MITINTDHGIVNVDTWDDVVNIPGFQKNLDSKKHKLFNIIGRYLLSDKIPCGLSHCHTKHARGYVVTTAVGAVTNIGKDCGKKHFGVDFEDLSRKFNRDLDEKEMRERLATFSFSIEEVEERMKLLRNADHGADWVNKRVNELQTRGGNVPDEVIQALAGMVRSGSGSVLRSRLASKDETERLREMGIYTPTPHFIEEQVGVIAGFEALYPEHDLKKLLIIDLKENLSKLKSLNQDTLLFEELKHWTRWISTVETTFDKSLEAINFGARLLTKVNLNQFNQTLKRPSCELFKKFLKSL